MADLDVNLEPERYEYTPTDAIVGGETQVQYSVNQKLLIELSQVISIRMIQIRLLS